MQRDPVLTGRKECERSFVWASQHALCLASSLCPGGLGLKYFLRIFFMCMYIYVCILCICPDMCEHAQICVCVNMFYLCLYMGVRHARVLNGERMGSRSSSVSREHRALVSLGYGCLDHGRWSSQQWLCMEGRPQQCLWVCFQFQHGRWW